MDRCSSSSPKGQPCLLLAGHSGNHVVAGATFGRDQAVRVAVLRGWPLLYAQAAAAGAFSVGPVSPEKWVRMLEASEAEGTPSLGPYTAEA